MNLVRVRKNVKNLSDDERTRFVNAVLAVKTKPSILHADDPTTNRYDDYVETHMEAMMAQMGDPGAPDFTIGWAHNSTAFFPWHRELLLQFENDLQRIDETITIPYWDWPDSSSSPLTPDFLGTNGVGPDNQVQDGPFAANMSAHWTLKIKDDAAAPNFLQRNIAGDTSANSLPTAAHVNRILDVATYDKAPWILNTGSFRSGAEYELHNLVHNYVGGTMGNMTSPNDPVFWLHHSNVDRLWVDWLHRHPELCPYLPSSGGPAGQNLFDHMIFSVGPSQPWPQQTKPVDMLDHRALGYSYDSEPQAEIRPIVQPTPTRMAAAAPLKGREGESRLIRIFPLINEVRMITASRRKSSSKKRMTKRTRDG
jgi:tyrosinase